MAHRGLICEHHKTARVADGSVAMGAAQTHAQRRLLTDSHAVTTATARDGRLAQLWWADWTRTTYLRAFRPERRQSKAGHPERRAGCYVAQEGGYSIPRPSSSVASQRVTGEPFGPRTRLIPPVLTSIQANAFLP